MSELAPFPVSAWGLVGGFAYGPAAQNLAKLDDFAGNVTRDYDIGGTYVERVEAVSFTLHAAAGGTARRALVSFLDQGGAPIAQAVAPFSLAATLTSRITFAVGVQQGGANDLAAIVGEIPALFLQPTYTVRLSILNGAAGDLASRIRILTSRFSTAPQGFPPGQGPE